MKIKISAALACFALLFALAFPLTAHADEGAPSLPAKVTAELSSDGVMLPVVKVNGEYSYRIGVYAASDTAYQNPVAEGVSKFVFEKPDKYLLKYTLEKKGEANIYLYTELTVTDEIPPVVTLAETREKYSVGSTVTLDYSATDNSGFAPEVEAKIYRNGAEYLDLDGSNIFKATEEGAYEIIVRATDRGGLTSEVKRSFAVGGENGVKNNKTLIIVLIAAISAVVIAAAVVITVILKGRKKAE